MTKLGNVHKASQIYWKTASNTNTLCRHRRASTVTGHPVTLVCASILHTPQCLLSTRQVCSVFSHSSVGYSDFLSTHISAFTCAADLTAHKAHPLVEQFVADTKVRACNWRQVHAFKYNKCSDKCWGSCLNTFWHWLVVKHSWRINLTVQSLFLTAFHSGQVQLPSSAKLFLHSTFTQLQHTVLQSATCLPYQPYPSAMP